MLAARGSGRPAQAPVLVQDRGIVTIASMTSKPIPLQPAPQPARVSARDRVARLRVRLAAVRHGVDPSSGAVALTFDDGPDPNFTPSVLDLLAERRVAATFFVVGDAAREHPGLVRRMLDEGHAVGSHTRTHPDPGAAGPRELAQQYRAGRKMVEAVTGAPVPLFRPPMGDLGWASVLAIRCSRVTPWLWTRDPSDWVPGRRWQDIVDELDALRAGDVVVLHDGMRLPRAPEALDRSQTVAAVPEVIGRARSRGLFFVTLPA
jgi:peptidoglycan-N-acetylglucosamine deacetylase